jgi:hypothetical protein
VGELFFIATWQQTGPGASGYQLLVALTGSLLVLQL